MPTFTNQDVMERVVPALRAVGAMALKPVSNLLVLQIRKVFEPHAAMLNEVRDKAMRNRAVLNKHGQLITRPDGSVVFASDSEEDLERQSEFSAAMEEVLEQTFECDMTIDYEEHLSKISVPANTLFNLGELLILPKDEEPESEESEEEERPEEES